MFSHPNAPFCQVIVKSEQVGVFWYTLVTTSLKSSDLCKGKNSLINRGIELWGKIEPEVKELSWLSFKKKIKQKAI